jgi:hypothetical protein
MGIFRDKTGMIFGRLTVLSFDHYDKHRHSHWRCLCFCGNETVVVGCNLVAGTSRSCGCGEIESRYIHCLVHGHTAGDKQTPEYFSWCAMMTRCYNQNREEWYRYGGRGITVCERWHSFENFYADMGDRPEGLQIERINNDGNYEPENCKWATRIEQTHNTRRNLWLTFDGRTLCVSGWAREMGMGEATIRQRFHKGLSPEECLAKPLSRN